MLLQAAAEALGLELAGMDAIVVGRSNIVGKPMAQLLLGESCTVTIAHSRTRDLPPRSAAPTSSSPRSAGRRWSRGDWIKPGATVIDVGINRVAGGGRCRRTARPAWSAMSISLPRRGVPRRSPRCRAASGR